MCTITVTGPEAMDNLLLHCFLKTWKTSAKKIDLPILTSNFYRLHMIPACPDGVTLDIKKSSYKKLSKVRCLSCFPMLKKTQSRLNRGRWKMEEMEWKGNLNVIIFFRHIEIEKGNRIVKLCLRLSSRFSGLFS